MMILMNGKAERLTPLSECPKTTISHYESWVNGGGCLFGSESEKLFYSATIYDGFGHPASKCGLCFEIVGTSETLRFRVMNVVFDSSKYSREHVAFYDMADNAFSVVHQFNGNPNVTSRIVACDYQIEVENNKRHK